jgi:hypothetical protein
MKKGRRRAKKAKKMKDPLPHLFFLLSSSRGGWRKEGREAVARGGTMS